MNNNLSKLLNSIKDNDDTAIVALLDRFNPLLLKYANKLNYDDAYSELKVHFISVIYNFPDSFNNGTDKENHKFIVSYINKAIIHKYQALSIDKCKTSSTTTEYDLNLIPSNQMDVCQMLDIHNAISNLSDHQRYIITELFMNDKSAETLALELNVSRQAIYKTRRIALATLRSQLSISA